MTKFSLLDTLWPLVKLYQLAGCFALERCESELFHPIETWKYLLRHIAVFTTIVTLNLVSVIPMNFVEVLKIEANFTTSKVDLAAFLFSVGAIFSLHVSLIWRNVKSKERLSFLLNDLTKMYSSSEISRCEALTPILMFIFFFLVGVVLVMIGYGFSILEKLDHVTLVQVVAYVIVFTFMMIVSGGPILTTILIYSDICEHLVLWIKEIRYVCMCTQTTNKTFKTKSSHFTSKKRIHF